MPIAPNDVDNESAVDVLARAKREMLNIVGKGDIPLNTLLHTDLQVATSTQSETGGFSGGQSHIRSDKDAHIYSTDTNDPGMNDYKNSPSEDVANRNDTLNNQVDAPDNGKGMRLTSSTSSFLMPPPHSPLPCLSNYKIRPIFTKLQ